MKWIPFATLFLFFIYRYIKIFVERIQLPLFISSFIYFDSKRTVYPSTIGTKRTSRTPSQWRRSKPRPNVKKPTHRSASRSVSSPCDCRSLAPLFLFSCAPPQLRREIDYENIRIVSREGRKVAADRAQCTGSDFLVNHFPSTLSRDCFSFLPFFLSFFFQLVDNGFLSKLSSHQARKTPERTKP